MLQSQSALLNHKKVNKILYLLRQIRDPEELPFLRRPGALYNPISFTLVGVALVGVALVGVALVVVALVVVALVVVALVAVVFGDSDLPYVTSVREIVISRTHVTVLSSRRNAETRRVAGGRCVVQLRINFATSVTPCVEVQVQLVTVKFIHVINHFKR